MRRRCGSPRRRLQLRGRRRRRSFAFDLREPILRGTTPGKFTDTGVSDRGVSRALGAIPIFDETNENRDGYDDRAPK